MLLVLLSVITVSVAGCKKEESMPPKINLDTREIEIAAAGGDYTVGYEISNPSADARLELFCWSEDWITGLSFTDTDIKFSANVNPSETEGRRAVISIRYLNIKDSIVVVQPASMNGENDLKVEVSVNSATSTSVNATFTPSDKEAPYHILTMTKANYDSAGGDDALVASIVAGLKKDAQNYGLSVAEYLGEYVLKTGDLTRDMPGLQPDTDYYVMAFGLSLEGEPTGALSKASAKTEKETGSSDVTFELKAEVNGSKADLTVVPSDAAARYFQGYVAESMLEYLGTDIKGVAEYMIQENIYYGTESGASIYEVVDEMSYYGTLQYTVDLYNATENILYAAAIDETGNIISDVASVRFAMEAITSDNEIAVEVTDISVDKALLKISTTNMDPYLVGVAEASEWAGLSDEQIVSAVQFYDDQPYNGDYSIPLGNLKGGTDYVVVVFGFQSEMVTTSVIRKYFCTQSIGNMEDLEFEFKIEDITPFGATVTVSATPVTNMYYWYVKPASMTEQEIKDDIDMIIQNYLTAGMISKRLDYFKVTGSRGTSTSTITSLESGKEYRAFAIGIEEEKGMYATPMAFSDVFKTSERVDVDINVELVVENYYDCNALIEAGYNYQMGAGKALANLKASISGSDVCDKYYFHMVMADVSNPEEYTDDVILDILFDYGFMNLERQQVFAPYDQTCTLLAVGLDADGNPGKIFRNTVTLTSGGVSDPGTYEPLYAPQLTVKENVLRKY